MLLVYQNDKEPSQNEKGLLLLYTISKQLNYWKPCQSCIPAIVTPLPDFRYVFGITRSDNGKSGNMKENKTDKKDRLGDEAPGWKHVIIVIVGLALLIAVSWIAWFKLGWFH